MHRALSLEYAGLCTLLDRGLRSFVYMPFPAFVAAQKLPESASSALPMVEDGMALWEIIATFAREYVQIFYKTDEALLGDAEAVRYWEALDASREAGAFGLPSLATAAGGARAALAEQLAHHMFNVSAVHEMVGNTVELLTDDRGFAGKVRAGQERIDTQAYFQMLCLSAMTSMRMPLLKECGWGAVYEGSDRIGASELADVQCALAKLKASLAALEASIDERNAARLQPFNGCNPKVLECSVSV